MKTMMMFLSYSTQSIKDLILDIDTIIKNTGRKYQLRLPATLIKRNDKLIFDIPGSFLKICFILEGTNYTYPALGIYIENEALKPDDELYKEITEKTKLNLPVSVRRGGLWPSWYTFEKWNIADPTEFWKKIMSGAMAQTIIKAVDEYYNILVEYDFISRTPG